MPGPRSFRPILIPLILLVVGWAAHATAADEPSGSYAEIVAEQEPVAYWRFPEKSGPTIQNEAGPKELGGILVEPASVKERGPRPAAYPRFEETNGALAPGETGRMVVEDPGDDSPLDFGQGDSITLEAWVNLEGRRLSPGQYVYIVGKGRTTTAKENQNYALRLAGDNGQAAVSFLFRSTDDQGKEQYHRWTANEGIGSARRWHHVAISYTFGKPDSIQGYVDGRSLAGKWDMDGATERPPVIDNDALWIGSARGGAASSTFPGLIDEVAIYRSVVPAEQLTKRYQVNEEAIAKPTPRPTTPAPRDAVLVEIHQEIPDAFSWEFELTEPSESWTEPAFALIDLPVAYERGLRVDRSNPLLVVMRSRLQLPQGKQRLLVRTLGMSRLFVDDKQLAEIPVLPSGDGALRPVPSVESRFGDDRPRLIPGIRETVAEFESDGQEHEFRLEFLVGGKQRRPEVTEATVSIARQVLDFRLLSPKLEIPFTRRGWHEYREELRRRMQARNHAARRASSKSDEAYWQRRHQYARDLVASQPGPELPSDVQGPAAIDHLVDAELSAAGLHRNPPVADAAFVRRLSLDIRGIIPHADEMTAYLNDPSPDRDRKWIDRFLADDRWADHWVGYWQDVLAENPNLVNPTLNNTGPFRWWIYESFLDNKPIDQFATELILMEGSTYSGGPAGFRLATENDVPMAAKAHILGQALLGVEMTCARCHDSPTHAIEQADLFSIAAMLQRSPVGVPPTSSITRSEEELAKMAVTVSIKPGEKIAPDWPFAGEFGNTIAAEMLRKPNDSREKLAWLMTGPQNERFAQVIVNRLWQRLMGRGIVEPLADWEYGDNANPRLIEFLSRELVTSGYDLKHVARLILNSQTYRARPVEDPSSDEAKLFAGPTRRRMNAEQLLDSLFAAAGKQFHAEPINIDVDATRPWNRSLNLGRAESAWHLVSLSNERDRPSLALPVAQRLVNLLETFGWQGARQAPRTEREDDPNVLQPAMLANSEVTRRITQLSDDSIFTAIARGARTTGELVEKLYLQVLSRHPSDRERDALADYLKPGFDSRVLHQDLSQELVFAPPINGVSWSNHLDPEANRIKAELERRAEQGDPPTQCLESDWRQRAEDVVWALINTPEFQFIP